MIVCLNLNFLMETKYFHDDDKKKKDFAKTIPNLWVNNLMPFFYDDGDDNSICCGDIRYLKSCHSIVEYGLHFLCRLSFVVPLHDVVEFREMVSCYTVIWTVLYVLISNVWLWFLKFY